MSVEENRYAGNGPHRKIAGSLDGVCPLRSSGFKSYSVAEEILFTRTPPRAPSLWLLNAEQTIGTSLFDQFRGMPSPHRFDLNAADEVDLAGIPAVSRSLAREIMRNAPYTDLAGLKGVPGMTGELLARIREMRTKWEEVAAKDYRHPHLF